MHGRCNRTRTLESGGRPLNQRGEKIKPTNPIDIKAYCVFSVNFLPLGGNARELTVLERFLSIPYRSKLWGHAQSRGRCSLLQEVLGLRDRLLIADRVRLLWL